MSSKYYFKLKIIFCIFQLVPSSDDVSSVTYIDVSNARGPQFESDWLLKVKLLVLANQTALFQDSKAMIL